MVPVFNPFLHGLQFIPEWLYNIELEPYDGLIDDDLESIVKLRLKKYAS